MEKRELTNKSRLAFSLCMWDALYIRVFTVSSVRQVCAECAGGVRRPYLTHW